MRPDQARCGLLGLAEPVSRLSKSEITDMPLNLSPLLAKRGPAVAFVTLPFTAGEDVASIARNFPDAAR